MPNMLNLILGLVLSFVIVVGIGNAYSQSDEIPEWIKGVAGLWAQDEITDSAFIEAMEFLIESNIIKIDDSQKILELEKENLELKQQNKLFESERISQGIIVDDTENQNNMSIYVNETQIKGNIKIVIDTIDITNENTIITLEITNLVDDILQDNLQTDILNVIIQDGKQYRKISKNIDTFIAPTVTVRGDIVTEPIKMEPFNVSFSVVDHSDGVVHKFVFDVEP